MNADQPIKKQAGSRHGADFYRELVETLTRRRRGLYRRLEQAREPPGEEEPVSNLALQVAPQRTTRKRRLRRRIRSKVFVSKKRVLGRGRGLRLRMKKLPSLMTIIVRSLFRNKAKSISLILTKLRLAYTNLLLTLNSKLASHHSSLLMAPFPSYHLTPSFSHIPKEYDSHVLVELYTSMLLEEKELQTNITYPPTHNSHINGTKLDF
eukprot:c20930_g1_i1 orf=78-701(+)